MSERDRKSIGELPHSKAGKKALRPLIERAAKNLKDGRRWDAPRKDG